MKIEALQRHCETLCEEYEILWRLLRPGSRKAYSLGIASEIVAPPVRGPISYATVLHEIGHVLGRYQGSRRVLVRETWAWEWARRNALIWTRAMEKSARSALDWYRPRAAKLDAKWRPPHWGGVDVE